MCVGNLAFDVLNHIMTNSRKSLVVYKKSTET